MPPHHDRKAQSPLQLQQQRAGVIIEGVCSSNLAGDSPTPAPGRRAVPCCGGLGELRPSCCWTPAFRNRQGYKPEERPKH
ncbi:hypothetical protein EJB05_42579, partial [Eragrostis curvula]